MGRRGLAGGPGEEVTGGVRGWGGEGGLLASGGAAEEVVVWAVGAAG